MGLDVFPWPADSIPICSATTSGGNITATSDKRPLNPHDVPSIHQCLIATGTNNVTTSSSSFVDMPNMSIDITTGANPILILFYAGTLYNGTSGNEAPTQLVIDGASGKAGTVAGNAHQTSTIFWLQTLSAGAHTIKIQWYARGGGTAYNGHTSSPSGARRVLIVIELKA